MPKLILHSLPLSPEEQREYRLTENLKLTHSERIRKMFYLMQLAAILKNGPLKIPQGKGIILKRVKKNK